MTRIDTNDKMEMGGLVMERLNAIIDRLDEFGKELNKDIQQNRLWIATHEPISYTSWSMFNALPFDLRNGVLNFWEPGYDYDDPDFWTAYKDPDPDFVEAVRKYDWLKRNDPEGEW